MLPSKPKSGLPDTLNNKTTPSTPMVGKIGRAGSTKADSSPSPLQKSRSSPRSVESKPTVERRSQRLGSITPDKQAQLGEVQEELKKAKEKLASAEQEKAQVLEELKDEKKLVDEANDKLKEALAAQKRAEESSEIEKFRADELEQAGMEAAQKREEGWVDEFDSIIKKHNLELEKIKDELEATTKAKITALNHVDDATRIAEINAEKVEFLSGEVSRLKYLLDSKIEHANSDKEVVTKKLDSEIDSLKYELERTKQAEEKLVAMESMVERLNNEVENVKSAELDSLALVDEWKKKSQFLESQLVEATQSEKSSLEFLASVTKQLEESKASLQDSEFETSALREKVEVLEEQLKSSSESQALLKKQLEEVNTSLQDAESETDVLRGKVESLEIEVSDVKKAELDLSKLADEWKKKAEFLEVQLVEANQHKETSSESLASVTKQLEESNSSLQDALSENDDLKVNIELLETQLNRYREYLMDSERRHDIAQQEAIEMGKEIAFLKSEIEILGEEKLRALNSEKAAASEEKNRLLKELGMAREEEEKAKKAMEGLASALHEMSTEARETQETLFAKRVEHEDANVQIEQLRSTLSNTEDNYKVLLDEARDEIACLKKAIEKRETEANDSQSEWNAKELKFVGSIKASEDELASFKAMKEDRKEIVSKFREAESRASSANEAVEEAKAETLRLRERLLDRENELQSISQENAELRIREAASIRKVEELSVLLAEATTKKPEGSDELSIKEKEYDLLPKSKEIPVESINGNTDLKLNEENGNGEDYNAPKKDDFSSKIERTREFVDIGMDMKTESGNFDHTDALPSEASEDGSVSPTKQQQQKKKKPLLQKFGSLLKKKSPRK